MGRRLVQKSRLVMLCVALCSIFSSCGSGADGNNEAHEQALMAIDDSIKRRSPQAFSLISEGMKSATDSLTYYEYCARMGTWYLLSATPDSMQPYVDKTLAYALRQPASTRRDALLALTYSCKATRLHNFHQQPDSVTAFYTQAYHYLMSSGNLSTLPDLCGNLADAYYFKDNLPEAAHWYRRALFLVDSLALPKSKDITLYLGLARIYMNLNDFSSSRKYYEQTERHFKEMQTGMQAYFLNDYGSYFYYAKDFKASLERFKTLEKMLLQKGMEHNFDMYLCRTNLADVYLNLGQLDEARRYLSMTEGYMRRMNDPVANYYINTIKIGIALQEGDMPTVQRILATEPAGACTVYNMVHIRNGYLQQYYARTGQYRQAYAVTVADMNMTDSMNSSRSNMRATEILNRFTQDTLRLHHDLAMQQKNAYIYRTNTLITVLVSVAIVLVLLLVLWIVMSRKQLLKGRMDIMQLKLSSARNRINPHFVFNVLNNNIINVRNDAATAAVADQLQDLARLIRANLDMSLCMTVTLAEELAFVERYVAIEQRMMGPDFHFKIETEPQVSLNEVRIPSMFLQILTENALVHGLKGWDGTKRLTIAVQPTSGATTITVTDNGRGFDIRSARPKKRTGLSIITQTITVMNEHNKQKMRFNLRNLTNDSGKVIRCQSALIIPDGMKLSLGN